MLSVLSFHLNNTSFSHREWNWNFCSGLLEKVWQTLKGHFYYNLDFISGELTIFSISDADSVVAEGFAEVWECSDDEVGQDEKHKQSDDQTNYKKAKQFSQII